MPSRSLSIEDRKLDAGVKIVAPSSRIYSDIDLLENMCLRLYILISITLNNEAPDLAKRF